MIVANIANYQVAKVNFIDNASNQLVSTYQIIDKVPTDWTWFQGGSIPVLAGYHVVANPKTNPLPHFNIETEKYDNGHGYQMNIGHGLTYTYYVAKNDVIKKHVEQGTITMVRHVHFVEQGNENVDLATPVDETVVFKVYADTKNSQVIPGTYVLDPISGEFPAVAPKSIAGYTVVPAEADGIAAERAQTTIKDSGQINGTVDLNDYIHYTQNGAPQPNPEPNPDPEPEPQPTPAPKPNPEDNGGKKNNHHATTVKPHATSNKAALKRANKVMKKLPQTCAKNNGVITAIGAAFAAVAGLFGLAGSKKRRF